MSVLLGVLVGILVVVLIVVVIGCLLLLWQHLRRRHQGQLQVHRLAQAVTSAQNEGTKSIEVVGIDDHDRPNHPTGDIGVRYRPPQQQQQEYPYQSHYSNSLNIANRPASPMPAPGTSTTTTMTITTTITRTPSPVPPIAAHHQYQQHQQHQQHHQHEQFASYQDETTERLEARPNIRNQQGGTNDSVASDIGDPDNDGQLVTEWCNYCSQQKPGGKDVADYLSYYYFDECGDLDRKKGIGKKLVDGLKKAFDDMIDNVSVEMVIKLQEDSNATEEIHQFARYLETTQEVEKVIERKDPKELNDYCDKLFDSFTDWRRQVLIYDFYYIYNALDAKCYGKNKVHLKNLPFGGNVYMGWDYEREKLLYVAPNLEHYEKHIRGQVDFGSLTICHFRFDTFYEVRELLDREKEERGIKDMDLYKLQPPVPIDTTYQETEKEN